MIEYENNGRIGGNVFETRDFDALEVDPQRESHEGDNDATNHVSVL